MMTQIVFHCVHCGRIHKEAPLGKPRHGTCPLCGGELKDRERRFIRLRKKHGLKVATKLTTTP